MKPYYDHAGITIYHGDCREVIPTLGGGFDLLLTDPPYGILSADGSAATRRSGGNQDSGVIHWDIAPTEAVVKLILGTAHHSAIWGGCHLTGLSPTFGYLVWDKQIDGLNFGEVEFCWTTGKFAPRIWRERAVRIDGGKLHPTQKPRKLMEWCLGFFPTTRTVLDPYMGSGTSLVAAKRLNKKATGIEQEEKFCEIAALRLSQEVFDWGEVA